MAWNPTFPTPATRISQSVQQIQDNWAFLQTNINTDHFYNSGAPNEGHHRFVQLITQGADPALALNGVLYSKAVTGGTIQPFYRNATNIQQVPTIRSGVAAVGGGGGNFSLANLAGTQPFSGFITSVDQATTATRGCAFIIWDGAAIGVTTLGVAGSIVAFVVLAVTSIGITSNAVHNNQWNIITFYN